MLRFSSNLCAYLVRVDLAMLLMHSFSNSYSCRHASKRDKDMSTDIVSRQEDRWIADQSSNKSNNIESCKKCV